jgi:branched-chain amino acid transport system ATP-binding protein
MRLEVRDVHSYYGASHILQGVSLTVEPGEVVALLGRNGAGKTTLMRSIVGLVRPRAGSVQIDGVELTGAPTYRAARADALAGEADSRANLSSGIERITA